MLQLNHPSYAQEFELSVHSGARTEISNRPRLELLYLLEGGAEVQSACQSRRLGPSDCCILNVMELCEIRYSENAYALCLSIGPVLLRNPAAPYIDFCTANAQVRPADAENVRTAVNQILTLTQRDAEAHRFGIYSHVYQIVDLLYRSYAAPEMSAAPGQEKLALLERMLDYIRENSSRSLRLEDLSRQFYLSSAHISRLFQSHLHVSFTQYLREVRLNNACDLLLSTGLPVMEIADRSGFGSTNRLIVDFRRKYGETPGRYRRLSHAPVQSAGA